MSFKDQDFAKRFDAMGDEAEAAFERYAENVLRKKFVRYGLNRPPLQMATLPARVRYTPDYLMSKCFVEVQGLGRDQTFKLKRDKLGSLLWWNDLRHGDFDGVMFYVWDSHNKRECFLPLLTVDDVIGQEAELAAFPEGKSYFAVPADAIFEAAYADAA